VNKLRPYQAQSVRDLWKWFEYHAGHPCLVLPTGAGKSHIIAAICKDAVQSYPDTRILMLTHVKELIEQNAGKLRLHWPNAPLGIFSAGIGRKELEEPITFAGIQSIRNQEVGHIDLCIIDECHLVSHKAEGTYRSFLKRLQEVNPNLRVIGLTATPFRMGHGLITDAPALFDDLIEPITIEELQRQGYLADLRSKVTRSKLSADGVHKRGGEYIEKELQQAVDITAKTEAVIKEVISLAGLRKSWLFFCTGISHAQHVKEILLAHGISADCITGSTSKKERERIIKSFKTGEIRALTNANVLTTGFDYPDIDLIVMLRPTMSPGLYMQMAGRGLRLKSHIDHCLVLDFAGVVETHGPITNVVPPTKAKGDGVAPCKVCPECDEIIHASLMTCPSCGYHFPPVEKEAPVLHDDDIQGTGISTMACTGWQWDVHTSSKSGIKMLKVTYFGALSDRPISEYLCVLHAGFVGYKAMETLKLIAEHSGADYMVQKDLPSLCKEMDASRRPSEILHKKDGRWTRVIDRIWKEEKAPIAVNVFEEEKIWF
jgi:DNA repair protein RadD